MRKILLLILFGLQLLPRELPARNPDSGAAAQPKQPKVRTEWGIQAGAGFWTYGGGENLGGLKGCMGWQAGISMAAIWGKWALQPEIRYVRHRVEMTLPGTGAPAIDLKSGSIEVPVLFSVRAVEPLRFYAGPVLTVLDHCTYSDPGGLSLDVGHVRPTLGYAVGASVLLGKRLLIDARYTGGFGSVKGVFWNEGPEVKLRGHAVQIGIGYVFR